MPKLITPSAAQRLIEIYMSKRDDAATGRLVSTLLCWSGDAAIGRVFQQLAEEPVAANRFTLIRLIGRLGPAALDSARQQIQDERWYVVRNACKILSELKDPDLPRQLAPVLRHKDERVQKAALSALRHSRLPERAPVFAEALPFLRPHAREEALQELAFLKAPATLPALEQYMLGEARPDAKVLVQAIQAVAAVPADQADLLLGRLLADAALDVAARRAALAALGRRATVSSRARLQEFVAHASDDPLQDEARKLLERAPK